MGVFLKKPLCPICGGKLAWFSSVEIQGRSICSDCAGKIDLPPERLDSLTLDALTDYFRFYGENQALKESFQVTNAVHFQDSDFIFDKEHALFCMSVRPDRTVFSGSDLQSFSIYEDGLAVFEGSAQGLVCTESTVPQRAMALAPDIQLLLTARRRNEQQKHMQKRDDSPAACCPVPQIHRPFEKFILCLRLDHPYWQRVRLEWNGPEFDGNYPDIGDYIRQYRAEREILARLAGLLMQVAFAQDGCGRHSHVADALERNTPLSGL